MTTTTCRNCGYFIQYEHPKAPAEPGWVHTTLAPKPPTRPTPCDKPEPADADHPDEWRP